MKIPKIIHFMWLPDFSKAPAYVFENITLWRNMNPEYDVIEWDEESVRKVIPKERIRYYDMLNMPIKKSDFARIELAIKFGGVYLDCDLIPNKSLDYFFSKKSIEKRYYDKRKQQQQATVDCDLSSKSLILSREWKDAFPKNGSPFTAMSRAANGIIISEPDNYLLKGFLESRYKKTDEKVLKYLGPHALTTYLMVQSKRRNIKDLAIIPPHHFLWEKQLGEVPDWAISTHMGQNSWGDHSKENYWDI